MSKTCFKCLCVKPAEEFYVHIRMADGRLGKCKVCTKSDVMAHRAANLEKVQAYDRSRGMLPHRVEARNAYQLTDAAKTSHQESIARWALAFPERKAAVNAVGNALRSGRLQKLPCLVCGEQKVEGHHPDYDQPLSVVWLCNKHHRETHAMTQERIAA